MNYYCAREIILQQKIHRYTVFDCFSWLRNGSDPDLFLFLQFSFHPLVCAGADCKFTVELGRMASLGSRERIYQCALSPHRPIIYVHLLYLWAWCSLLSVKRSARVRHVLCTHTCWSKWVGVLTRRTIINYVKTTSLSLSLSLSLVLLLL